MDTTRARWRLFPGALALAMLGAAGCSGNGSNTGISSGAAATAASRPAPDDMGVVAYVDANGCIARVAANGSNQKLPTFCPQTRQGVTFVAWQDATSVSYVVPESAALGWRFHDFETGADGLLPVDEAPKIRLLATAPWYRSAKGEVVEFDAGGTLYRLDNGSRIPIFWPAAYHLTGTPRLATWSPDSQWLLLFVSPGDALWVVKRDGSIAFQVAESSRAQVAWFMPDAGALPHLDLTCTTASAFNCRVNLQSPADGASVPGSVLLEWSLCPGATGYELEVTPETGGQPVVQHLSVATTFRVPGAVLTGSTTWHWRVRPLIGTDRGEWSQERTFRTGN